MKDLIFSPHVLMLDNETLSKRPDAYITQVGYVVGNVLTGEVSYGPTNVNLMTPRDTAAHIDVETVRWWMTEPSDEARKAVFSSGQVALRPRELFSMLAGLTRQFGKGMTVWAKPAMFDLPQLTTAWRGEKPWGFRCERDLATLAAVIDPYGKLEPPKDHEADALRHTGAADALWQFNYLCNLVAVLRQNDMYSWAKVLDGAEAA